MIPVGNILALLTPMGITTLYPRLKIDFSLRENIINEASRRRVTAAYSDPLTSYKKARGYKEEKSSLITSYSVGHVSL